MVSYPRHVKNNQFRRSKPHMKTLTKKLTLLITALAITLLSFPVMANASTNDIATYMMVNGKQKGNTYTITKKTNSKYSGTKFKFSTTVSYNSKTRKFSCTSWSSSKYGENTNKVSGITGNPNAKLTVTLTQKRNGKRTWLAKGKVLAGKCRTSASKNTSAVISAKETPKSSVPAAKSILNYDIAITPFNVACEVQRLFEDKGVTFEFSDFGFSEELFTTIPPEELGLGSD